MTGSYDDLYAGHLSRVYMQQGVNGDYDGCYTVRQLVWLVDWFPMKV